VHEYSLCEISLGQSLTSYTVDYLLITIENDSHKWVIKRSLFSIVFTRKQLLTPTTYSHLIDLNRMSGSKARFPIVARQTSFNTASSKRAKMFGHTSVGLRI
jgi:hypothetical protein